MSGACLSFENVFNGHILGCEHSCRDAGTCGCGCKDVIEEANAELRAKALQDNKGSTCSRSKHRDEDKSLENLIMLEDSGDDARYMLGDAGTSKPTPHVLREMDDGLYVLGQDDQPSYDFGVIEKVDPRRTVASRRELDDDGTIWIKKDVPNASKSTGGTNKGDLIMLE